MLATIVLEMSKKNLFSKIDGGCAFSNRFDSEEMMVAGDSDSYIITVKFKEPAGERTGGRARLWFKLDLRRRDR